MVVEQEVETKNNYPSSFCFYVLDFGLKTIFIFICFMFVWNGLF